MRGLNLILRQKNHANHAYLFGAAIFARRRAGDCGICREPVHQSGALRFILLRDREQVIGDFMKSRYAGALVLAAGLLAAGGARAQDSDEDMCRNGLFPSQREFALATVAGTAPRLYFFNDWDGCPQKGASCQTKAYVLPGDRLLLGKTHGEWTCAWYQGKSRETVGWVRKRDLAAQAETAVQTGDWLGKWREVYKGPGRIGIARAGDTLQVNGKTRWIGQNTENFGGISGTLGISGRHGHVGPAGGKETYACSADMVRIGDFLIVHDNGGCGGLNVRFDGLYVRTP
jgi:hypothetical protein